MRILKKILSKLKKSEFTNAMARLVVCNKQLHLYYGKTKISSDLGMHTAFLINGCWHDTSSGIWQVEDKKDVLHITIDWEQLPLRVLWQISKIDNGFNLMVYMDVKEPLRIEKIICGIMIRQEYEKWVSGVEEGRVPAFNKSWEKIFLLDLNGKLLGVKNTQNLPAVIFENLQHGQLLFQNSPEDCRSRALRIEVDKHNESIISNRYKPFNVNLCLFENEAKTAEFLSQKNKQLLESRQLEEGRLKLTLKNSSIHLSWNNLVLTANQGLHAALLINDEWFDASKCKWQVERISPSCLYINIDWRPLPIHQYWQLRISDENSFTWKVKTIVNNSTLKINKQVIGMILRSEYKQWFGGYETGQFPQSFDGWQEMIRDLPEGIIGLKNNNEYPAIMFKNHEKNKAALVVQNSDKNAQARFLQAVKENAFDDESIAAGGSLTPELMGANNEKGTTEFTFSQEIKIVPEPEIIEEHLSKIMHGVIMQRGIENDKLKLLADKGKLRIFWRDQELTTNIGMHTALFSSGRWYDSGKMKWVSSKLSTDKLRIDIDFKPFPAQQTWDIYFEDDKTISWQVNTLLKEAVQIDEHKAGCMLTGKYRRWFNSFEEGLFPEKFGFWHDIIRNRDGDAFGTFPENNLPGIMFLIDDNSLSLIQNTDEHIKGRVLQAEILEGKEAKIFPAKYQVCFKGKIRIIEKEQEIKDYKLMSQPLTKSTEAIYIYGDNEFLHNRIDKAFQFNEKINKLQSLSKRGQNVKIAIGVCRYNFFKLNEILQFVAKELGKNVDLRSLTLAVLPLRRLRRNFIEYLDELKAVAKGIGNVEFVLTDNGFFELLTSVSVQAGTGNERQLLRLLGVICEHAFIGPQIVVIDPYHRCNANCVHCWVHTPSIKHPQEFLDRKLTFEAFKSIADDLSDLYTDLMIFQGDGEPLLHERFFDMVKYGRDKGIDVSFFTNGILLNKEVAKKAVDFGVSEIFCSLPAGKAETFAKINTKQNEKAFLTILENLKYLTDYKKQTKAKSPRLIVTHVIHAMNAHELIEMAENDIAVGADVLRFYLVRLDQNIDFLKLKPEDIAAVKLALPKIKQMVKGKEIKLLDTTEFQLNNFEQKTGSWSKDVFLEKGCALGWSFSLIPAAGDVSFCCHLRTVGYLKDKTFKEIWNSEEYARFRYQAKYLNDYKQEKFLNGNPLFDDYCQHCDTHQVIRDVWDKFALYNLEAFLD
ncbi:MAG: radical SAM protein [Candidatus Omnitrophica bacterium]|nr:radical SAM protein [Candidatus Omnitrophota bacterium]